MPFSIRESIKFGWESFKNHSGILLYAVLLLAGVEVANSIGQAMFDDNAAAYFGVNLLFGILSFVLGAGFVVISLKIVKGEHPHRRDIIPPFILLWRYLVVNFAVVAMMLAVVLIGAFAFFVGTFFLADTSNFVLDVALALFIAVGVVFFVYIALRYSMAFYAVLEGEKVIESLKKSAVMTRGVKLKLVAFGLALVVVNIVGLLCLVVGLLVSIPVTAVAYAHVYTKLKGHAGKKP